MTMTADEAKPCSYCHTDLDGYAEYLPREGEGRFHIWKYPPSYGGWVINFSGKYNTRAKISINFCPMCGRELTEDTW